MLPGHLVIRHGLRLSKMVREFLRRRGAIRQVRQQPGQRAKTELWGEQMRASQVSDARVPNADWQPRGAAPVAESPASNFSIPEDELTPSVRAALAALNERAEHFKREAEIANARLADASRYADLDVLLPILNRRAFVREVNRVIAFAERYGTPSCLIYFDIDDFKSVNDTFGHSAGDFVLNYFVGVMAAHIRDTDILARIGGDEFGIILSHVTQDQAAAKGERLMRAINQSPAIWNDAPVPLRFSYGIYRLRAGESAEAAIANADEAMYAHKRSSPA